MYSVIFWKTEGPKANFVVGWTVKESSLQMYSFNIEKSGRAEKFRTSATFVTLHLFKQAIWGDMWKLKFQNIALIRLMWFLSVQACDLRINVKTNISENCSHTTKGRRQKKTRDYVGTIPKLGGGSDPNPLLDVYLPNYFWHAKMILRC